jgi:hypothetical protein
MIGRRQTMAVALAALGLVPAGRARAAEAAHPGTLPEAAVRYRDHPLGEKSCAKCAHFLHPAVAGEEAHCTVVAGPVAADGYCVAWQDANPSNTC